MNRSRLALHFELLISKFHRVGAEISGLEIESISRISPINPALEAAPALTLRHFSTKLTHARYELSTNIGLCDQPIVVVDSTTDRAKNTVVTEEQQAPVREISNIEMHPQLLKKI